MARRKSVRGSWFPRSFVIPMVVGLLLLAITVFTSGFSQNQDIRSRAAFAYPTPISVTSCISAPSCTFLACGGSRAGYAGGYCNSSGQQVDYTHCRETCSSPYDLAPCYCFDGSLCGVARCIKAEGCSNLYYWGNCQGVTTPTPIPECLQCKVYSTSASSGNSSVCLMGNDGLWKLYTIKLCSVSQMGSSRSCSTSTYYGEQYCQRYGSLCPGIYYWGSCLKQMI
jgi:hypothetical protein